MDGRPIRRRTFLAATAATLAATGLPGCRRRPGGAGPAAPETATTPLPRLEPIVRVRLGGLRRAGAPIVVATAGGWIQVASRRGDRTRVAGFLAAPIQVTAEGRGWSILDAAGYRASVELDATIALAPLDGGDVTIDGRAYPGSVRLVPRGEAETPTDRWELVNDLPLERYLPGVLAGELYAHWHPETFAAQAVAARSFAAFEAAWWSSRRAWDLHDDTRSQMFLGSAAGDRAIEAVRATRGIVLGWEGRLLPGYYSACCGGTAAAASELIGPNPVNALPPLAGHDEPDVCVGAPGYRWTRERGAGEVARRLAAWRDRSGAEPLARLVRVDAIEPHRLDRRGRPLEFEVRGSGGFAAVLGAGDLRRAVDAAAAGLPAPEKPLLSSFVSVARIDRGRLRFEGRGAGHGVGLCQHGAEVHANAGRRAEEILAWYYPGAGLHRAWG